MKITTSELSSTARRIASSHAAQKSLPGPGLPPRRPGNGKGDGDIGAAINAPKKATGQQP
jgi:hypothetical protein